MRKKTLVLLAVNLALFFIIGRYLSEDRHTQKKENDERELFSQAFTDAMLLDFEQYGESVIAEVRQKDPSTYVRIATALIPSKTEQEIEVKDTSAESVSEIDWDIIVGGKKD